MSFKKRHLNCGLRVYFGCLVTQVFYNIWNIFSCTVVFYVSTYSLKYTLCHLPYLFSAVVQSRLLFAVIIDIWTVSSIITYQDTFVEKGGISWTKGSSFVRWKNRQSIFFTYLTLYPGLSRVLCWLNDIPPTHEQKSKVPK